MKLVKLFYQTQGQKITLKISLNTAKKAISVNVYSKFKNKDPVKNETKINSLQYCNKLKTFTKMSGEDCDAFDRGDSDGQKPDKMFTLKKWNAVAMWSWDVECDTCAICRVQVMDACLRCQGESKKDSYGKQDCVVVWGECNHSFHFCCMSLWVKQNNRCPLCQQEWSIQRMGK